MLCIFSIVYFAFCVKFVFENLFINFAYTIGNIIFDNLSIYDIIIKILVNE